VKYIGLILLSLWLIALGLGDLLNIYFPKEQKILPIINMAAGVFLVLCIIKIKRGEIGLLFLGFWAVLQSSLFLFHYSFNHSNTVVHILGIIAGVLLIFKI
jgi:membrane protein insertase Oxa1/YidC/SpoIIIJ